MPKMKPKIKKADTTQKVSKKPVKRKNEPSKGKLLRIEPPKKPKWLSSIPHSSNSHGSTPEQKKLWRIVADYKKIADWYDYGGKCISCQRRAEHWTTFNAGHYKSFSVCKGYDKWRIDNIFLQCSLCNGSFNSDTHSIGYNFAMSIVERYGVERLEELETYSYKPAQKIEEYVVVDIIRNMLLKMDNLPEKPEYYIRARKLLKEEEKI